MTTISFVLDRPLSREVLFNIGERLPLESCAKLVQVSKHVFPFTTDESFLAKRVVSWQLNIPQGQFLAVLKQGFPLLRSLQRLKDLTPNQVGLVIKGVLEGDHGQLLTRIMEGFDKDPIATHDLQCVSPANRLADMNIGGIFKEAIEMDRPKCLQSIINCSRFTEISVESLGRIFERAIELDRPKCLQSIINCSRFTEISAEHLGSGFKSAARGGFLDCLQAIIQCNQFANVPLQNIKEGYCLATQWAHKGCISAINQIKRDDVQTMLKETVLPFSISWSFFTGL